MRNARFIMLLLLAMPFNMVGAQQIKPAPTNSFLDISAGTGASTGSIAASYIYNWRTGKNRKFEIGIGARVTSHFGTKNDYITAPARLARSTSFPFLVVFAAQEEQNFDTLTVQRPLVFATNITFNLGYNFTSRLYGGVNIDVIGFTVGRNSSAILKSYGTTTTEPVAKPAAFNLLLTGDNDLGSLNSEFFIKYKTGNRLSIKGFYQFLFAEYKTTTVQQIAPDGTAVNRFRNKINAFGLGLSYNLTK